MTGFLLSKGEVDQHRGLVWQVEHGDYIIRYRRTVLPVLRHKTSDRRVAVLEAKGPMGKAGVALHVQPITKTGELGHKSFWIGQNNREDSWRAGGYFAADFVISKTHDSERILKPSGQIFDKKALLVLGGITMLIAVGGILAWLN